jgi:hypothetical protein
VQSSDGGAFDAAEWPGGQQTLTSAAGCSATVNRPSGNISNIAGISPWGVQSFQGYQSCFGTGGEDGDGCQVKNSWCTNALAIGYCDSAKPACTVELNGSGYSEYYVKCLP